jgi:hypothetical protein
MRIIAPMMILIMMTSTLAGCTGGDPDGGGEIDSDALNDLIDQNLQDFINNTTITVNQEIHNHYHNNTTIVSNDNTVAYNNTTINEGDSIVNEGDDNNLNEWSNTSYNLGGATFGEGVNGTLYSESNMMFVAHIVFDSNDIFPNSQPLPDADRNRTFTYEWGYYDYFTNSNRNDTFAFSCQVFYLIGSLSNNSTSQVSYFLDNDNYHDAWSNEYNGTIANMLQDAGQSAEIRSICDESFIASEGALTFGQNGFEYTFFSIDIPQGYAIQYIQLDSLHNYNACPYIFVYSGECLYNYQPSENSIQMNFNYSQGPSPHSSYDFYYGGWDNLTVDFHLEWSNTFSSDNEPVGYSEYGVHPSSEYQFTLYYQFIPVIPTE